MNRWTIGVIVALGLMCMAAGSRILYLERQLAARPELKEKSDVRERNEREEGAVVTTRRFAPPAPGCTEPALLEERVERGPIVSSSSKHVARERTVEPVALPPSYPRYFFGGGLDDIRALDPKSELRLRLGISIGGRLDLAYSKKIWTKPLDGHGVDAAWRFGGR